jgi:hypothetical protein
MLACFPDVEDLETAIELADGMKDQARRLVCEPHLAHSVVLLCTLILRKVG